MNETQEVHSESTSNSNWLIPSIIIALVVVGAGYWLITSDEPKDEVKPQVVEQASEPVPLDEPTVDDSLIENELPELSSSTPPPAELVEPEPVITLPSLNESDAWLKEKLPSITWRKELLKLLIDEDIIRRFVVFTDNFAQGTIAYEHSPLVKPNIGFTAREVKYETGDVELLWDESATRRFSLYVDLLRSIDSDTLVQWYFEMKPLVDEAYRELGYPDEEFTYVLQDAIARVLDMEVPKTELTLERPSVMFKFANQDVEAMDDADKLLLRLGKDNLLVIKSILLEVNEKLAKENN
ncbi:DUF3014 domain-containing protein [Thalassotalea fusca]